MNAKAPSMEILREKWLRQLMADPAIKLSQLKVAITIGFHLNRNKGGSAWPGIRTIAKIAHIDPRTVMRAIPRLESQGHLRVTRTRKGERNLANNYRPILERASVACATPRGIIVPTRRGIAVSPKPLSEPLTEPPILINISAPTGVGGERSGIRERKGSNPIEKPTATPERLESPRAECYRLAGECDGDRGRSLVTKALEHAADQDVLDQIHAAIEAGDDLGYALSEFWKHSGR